MTTITEMTGSAYPVIQGPIGAINSAELIATISNAGGYGMMALGFTRNIDDVKKLINEVKAKTDKPFGANLMIINPLNEQIIPILADAGIKTVTTAVGFPGKIYPLLHDMEMKGLHVVLSLKHAVSAVETGADGIVAAGSEAGGLRSTGPESSTMILVPLIADHVNVPVVAAGGIADSRGYRAALTLGASGVQLGTRLLASHESPVHKKWKELIVQCGDGGTELLPVENLMMRAIMTDEIKNMINSPGFDIKKEFQLKNADKAWNSADFDLVPAGAGQVSALINEVRTVKEIIDEMVK
jgi:enoyl-[acyl-carrier protein] reductase II